MASESVPCLPFFLDAEATTHLAGMMRARPRAAGWHLTIAWVAGIGPWVEEREGAARPRDRTTAWPTSDATSASFRLTPPPEQLDGLRACLQKASEAHVEAIGGPPDSVRYFLDVYPTETRLTASF